MSDVLQVAIAEWGTQQVGVVVEAVKKEAPTGRTRQLEMFGSADAATTLKASIRGRVRGRSGKVTMEITSGVSYALIIRDGRGTVVPVNAKVLHWINELGQDVFAMKSGPVAPNPFPTRAWKKVRNEVRDDLRHRLAMAAMSKLIKTAKEGGMRP